MTMRRIPLLLALLTHVHSFSIGRHRQNANFALRDSPDDDFWNIANDKMKNPETKSSIQNMFMENDDNDGDDGPMDTGNTQAYKSRTQRIMESTTDEQSTGAGGSSTYEAFLKAEENWSRLKQSQAFSVSLDF